MCIEKKVALRHSKKCLWASQILKFMHNLPMSDFIWLVLTQRNYFWYGQLDHVRITNSAVNLLTSSESWMKCSVCSSFAQLRGTRIPGYLNIVFGIETGIMARFIVVFDGGITGQRSFKNSICSVFILNCTGFCITITRLVSPWSF